jgi:hypothetical protein
VLEFDQEDARQAGQIRAHLASKGTPIGPYDVLIAGPGQGARADARHAQHHRVPTSTRPEGRGLEGVDFAAGKGRKAMKKIAGVGRMSRDVDVTRNGLAVSDRAGRLAVGQT